MSLHWTSAALTAVLAFAPLTAAAAECREQGAIVALSDYILDKRAELPRLQQRRFGAEAVYLTIRYEPLDPAATEALLASLTDAGIRDLGDLSLAWRIHQYGPDVALADAGAGALEIVDSAGGISATRALILGGAVRLVFERISSLSDDLKHGAIQAITAAIIDQPDALKVELADIAADLDEPLLAAALAAIARDPEIWNGFITGVSVGDAEKAAMLTRTWNVLPTYLGNPALLLEGAPPDPQDTRRRLYETISASALQPEADLLSGFLNYSGLLDPSHDVAVAVIAAFRDGTLDPDGTLDEGWRFTYRALKDAMADDEPLNSALQSMPYQGRVLRPTVADVLEWSLAIEAISPYLRGEADNFPTAPEGPYGPVRDWSDWLVPAEFVKSAPLFLSPGDDERSLTIMSEMLFAADKPDGLVNLLKRSPVSLTSLLLAADFAQRYDRGCASYTHHLAESVMLLGTPIYKFDDPSPLEPVVAPAADEDRKGGSKNR